MATELEILRHAKGYLDKLANGINPLTDEALNDTDVVNQVRISRCLFFVSDVLRQVIEKGGMQAINGAKITPTLPFHLTQEQRLRFPCSRDPVYISRIAALLNELAENEQMKPLSYDSISAFLTREGCLEQTVLENGQTKRGPTEKGLALGIRTEQRVNQKGVTYRATLYGEAAQRFIVAHLDEIEQLNRLSGRQRKLEGAQSPQEASG